MARILIVDDEPSMRLVSNRILTRLGHEIVEAGDGMIALKAVLAGGFDLVVTDIIMPEMEGLDLIFQLHRKFPELPILAISGGGRGGAGGADTYLRTASLGGAKRTLTKPFSIAEFVTAVHECLDLPLPSLPAGFPESGAAAG